MMMPIPRLQKMAVKLMDNELEATARLIVKNSPCSLEMPAGTGKTHLIAAAVAVVANEGGRSLILTHTNAGVDALRKRLNKFNVKASSYHIDTITGWAFTLIRSYGTIAGIEVSDVPDWSASKQYIESATNVVRTTAIGLVHANSFSCFFVDEYQDCNVRQHTFLSSIADNLEKTIIFGDRLQGIFGFAGETLVDWDCDVFPRFPQLHIPCFPYRWCRTNPQLGQWLLDLRPNLVDGNEIDFSSVKVPGFKWVYSSQTAVTDEAYRIANLDETAVLLDKWAANVATHASRLRGTYSMMEELQGKFMIQALEKLPPENQYELTSWLVIFAKSCAVGLSGIDKTIMTALNNNRPIIQYKRKGIEDVIGGLEELRQAPSYAKLVEVSSSIRNAKDIKIYRWEAWTDTIDAIRNSIISEETPIEELFHIRDRQRKIGRRSSKRIASRTLLVKGLEYDHVIVADMMKMCDPKNLYVALTRASKSITLIGPSPIVQLKNEN